jgi:hypothetical protein
MHRYAIVFICILLLGCHETSATEYNQTVDSSQVVVVSSPIPTQTIVPSTLTSTTTPSPSMTFTSTLTLTPTPTVTKYPDNTLNCPGSIALMYHHISKTGPKNSAGYGLTTDLKSFEKVLEYLILSHYYFPSSEEFALDIASRVCRHKYAIIIIDDTWNDPQDMGITDILLRHGGGTGLGSPSVWLGVITWMHKARVDEVGNPVDHWQHLLDLQATGLVHMVSHSQTHPVQLVNKVDIYDPANDPVYAQIASELGPSKNDIVKRLGRQPYFFVYPGGNVNQTVIGKMPGNYVGAFTVTAGGLDKAYPYLLPRINGAMLCNGSFSNNYLCVIEQIERFSNN